MDRRKFLVRTGQAALLLGFSPASLLGQAPPQSAPDIANTYRDSIVIDALGSPVPRDGVPPASSDLQQARQSGITAVNYTVSGRNFDDTVKSIAFAQWLAEQHPDIWLLVRRHSDLARAKRERKTGIILGFQFTEPFENDLSLLETFRGLGVRIIQMSYNNRGLLGDGCLEPGNAGLSKRGKDAVAKLNQLGIAVDLSHCGQQTTADGIATSSKPVLITHTGCNAVHRHPRNKDDRELRALADRGGVIGVYFMPYLCTSPQVPSRDIVLQHLAHALQICGEDHVGIGSDNSVQAVELTEDQRKRFLDDMANRKRVGIAAPEEDRLPYVPDLNGPRKLETLAAGLAQRGHGSSAITKVLGGNFSRVLGEIWGTA
jgi:membrane dipeptidase